MHVVITGASRGIGKALAERYAGAGARVTGTSRSDGGDATLDVTDPKSHAAFASSLGHDAVDLLVCNAGIYPDKGETLDTGYPPAMWAEAMATNVTGVFLSIQSLLPHLSRSDRPRVAIISSQMASDTLAPGGSYVYRASKAAVLNLGRNLATDLAPRGIAVGIYHPGWVRTDMGGDSAAISPTESADGLHARFDELDLDTTGCFRTWDGREHPF
ncbi:SDR family NAD(P)-dependent oxidoreductase [Roseovarius sp. SCSIO 43702]|uniref:SDR family NAD(P)-dependent oxidoreductase n=1 Tax=Roseovarius sp. SCSIO 43702 TaxID=2823043 RepID=UPI001C72AAE1|nr:SDR family NAD(P)-dependent oxidoreductase [Roseovarius sp. SCSIO 43702]QYX56076.1 SDR family NAD(P)-dependent oxidoreductase [Roseovarius sp. SCSIO 43702]